MKTLGKRTTATLAAWLVAASCGAAALPPLGEQAQLIDQLVSVRVADRIRKTCPTIGARLLRVLSESNAMKNAVIKLGYEEAEVRAFLKDKSERAKVYARAEAYLEANGAAEGDIGSFCALGRREIAANTYAGSLIYEK